VGGLGTIGAGASQGAVTYNAGGFAAGLDRAFTDRFRAGVTVGSSAGTQWVSGFNGQGNTGTVQFGLYGTYADGPVHADALVGYAYSSNRMIRQIVIPGLQSRTAWGQTGANQLFGQLEAGYRFDIGTRADAYVTPFARMQAYAGTQNGFTESGAQSLDLSVAQQTTNSLRSVLGAQLGGAIDMGWREKLALQFRLGWSHEYANVGRPVTAALAGAPAAAFTTFGISPTRDGALLGFGASTAVAEATSLYLRYEGTLAGRDGSHALTAGVRMRW
jgi:outer membrane autotransporter protein